jgi:serine/threonine-protein kinase RsbT
VSPTGRPDDVRIDIAADTDIVKARQVGREMAAGAGCSATDLTMVATAISEVARNILTHAGGGEVEMRMLVLNGRRCLEIVARDEGPGIADLERALEDGFTTGEGLGLGLPGARRLMDAFSITSQPGQGTIVVMRKWCGG